MAKQAKAEPYGFNVAAATTRLEHWFVENVAAPVRTGLTPAERKTAIRAIALDYWIGHAQWHWVEDEGQLQRLAVALAILEISAYEVALREMNSAEMVLVVDPVTGRAVMSPPGAVADELAASPLSLAVMNHSGGRPKNLLADAVAQQLRIGFTHQAIADFMGSSEGATRWRCKAKETRSLANVLGARPAAAAVDARTTRRRSTWPGRTTIVGLRPNAVLRKAVFSGAEAHAFNPDSSECSL